MTWDADSHRRDLFRAVDEVAAEIEACWEQFQAASSDAERWPIARRMFALAPRAIALRAMLDRVN